MQRSLQIIQHQMKSIWEARCRTPASERCAIISWHNLELTSVMESNPTSTTQTARAQICRFNAKSHELSFIQRRKMTRAENFGWGWKAWSSHARCATIISTCFQSVFLVALASDPYQSWTPNKRDSGTLACLKTRAAIASALSVALTESDPGRLLGKAYTILD